MDQPQFNTTHTTTGNGHNETLGLDKIESATHLPHPAQVQQQMQLTSLLYVITHQFFSRITRKQ